MHKGILHNWHDEKGYGFIQPDQGGKPVFAHIRDFHQRHPRPAGGEQVKYDLGADSKGRPRAVRIVRVELEESKSGKALPAFVIISYFGGFTLLTLQGQYPLKLPAILAGLSLLSFLQYGLDKRRALKHRFRISEARLHFLDLLGGWPGGLLAQRTFRHKVSKPEFLWIFRFTALLNILVLFYGIRPKDFWDNATYQEYQELITTRIQHHLEVFE